jgi:predicted metal-dependent peptidase
VSSAGRVDRPAAAGGGLEAPLAAERATRAAGLEAVKVALRLVCALLPQLSGLAALVRVELDARVGTAGIFRSGRLLLNPSWFAALRPADGAFVMAHELMHLALRTHERSAGINPAIANVAHDFVINDMLSESLGREVPAGGLELAGARSMSMEELAARVRWLVERGRPLVAWADAQPLRLEGPGGSLGAALRQAGLAPSSSPGAAAAGSGVRPRLDVLESGDERAWFPDESTPEREAFERRMRDESLRAASLSALREGITRAFEGQGNASGGMAVEVSALRTAYRPPWHEAVQSFLEATTPGPRTYLRASRRGADRADVVLPGRARDGRTLHVILDTSGSMHAEFARLAGVIRSFCEGVNIQQIRLLQCDTQTTHDELIELDRFEHLTLEGLGGSNLSDAMYRLAADPEVLAAVVLTDGMIEFPPEPMPYAVLWALTPPGFSAGNAPGYGRLVFVGE